jgi:hypothetical protein
MGGINFDSRLMGHAYTYRTGNSSSLLLVNGVTGIRICHYELENGRRLEKDITESKYPSGNLWIGPLMVPNLYGPDP